MAVTTAITASTASRGDSILSCTSQHACAARSSRCCPLRHVSTDKSGGLHSELATMMFAPNSTCKGNRRSSLGHGAPLSERTAAAAASATLRPTPDETGWQARTPAGQVCSKDFQRQAGCCCPHLQILLASSRIFGMAVHNRLEKMRITLEDTPQGMTGSMQTLEYLAQQFHRLFRASAFTELSHASCAVALA